MQQQIPQKLDGSSGSPVALLYQRHAPAILVYNASDFSKDGSTGNIEMGENDAAWLYHNTEIGDSVIVY